MHDLPNQWSLPRSTEEKQAAIRFSYNADSLQYAITEREGNALAQLGSVLTSFNDTRNLFLGLNDPDIIGVSHQMLIERLVLQSNFLLRVKGSDPNYLGLIQATCDALISFSQTDWNKPEDRELIDPMYQPILTALDGLSDLDEYDEATLAHFQFMPPGY